MHLHELPLWKRELALHQLGLMKPVKPSQCIVWEDPLDPDAPAKITTPSPQWLCMATMGGVLPPVEAYHSSRLEIEVEGGRSYNVSMLEADDVRRELRQRGQIRERVVRYDVHEAPVMSSMTEHEAIDYILRKDTPHRVWGQGGNRPHFFLTERRLIPQSRFVRNAWVLGEGEQEPVSVDMKRARKQFMDRMAKAYQARMRDLQEKRDVALWIGEDVEGSIEELRGIDRDALVSSVNAAQTAEQLEQLVPEPLRTVLES